MRSSRREIARALRAFFGSRVARLARPHESGPAIVAGRIAARLALSSAAPRYFDIATSAVDAAAAASGLTFDACPLIDDEADPALDVGAQRDRWDRFVAHLPAAMPRPRLRFPQSELRLSRGLATLTTLSLISFGGSGPLRAVGILAWPVAAGAYLALRRRHRTAVTPAIGDARELAEWMSTTAIRDAIDRHEPISRDDVEQAVAIAFDSTPEETGAAADGDPIDG